MTLQLQMMMKRCKVEKVEATLLHMLLLGQEGLEIHTVHSGQWGKRWETGPTGLVSGPCEQLPV